MKRVYEARDGLEAHMVAGLMEQAGIILGAGQAVLLDAVFAAPQEREAAEAVAADAGAPFCGLWLQASTATLQERVEARRGAAGRRTNLI